MMTTQPRAVFLPHANLQYSQLPPQKREWVVRNCYARLFALVEEEGVPIGFEASGKTVDLIAQLAPDVMQQLRALVQRGQLEPVASPYIHLMTANIPPEAVVHSLRRSLDTWEKHTGVRPQVGWNPECGWGAHVLDAYKEAGLRALVMDADSFLLSFPEIREATGLRYDVQGHSNKTKLFRIEEYIRTRPQFLRFLTAPTAAPNGLALLFRSDCMANLLLWYLMGATEGQRGKPVEMAEIEQMFAVWKERVQQTGSFLLPYAEDAEYIGSSAYFYVKQFNEARFFTPAPQSVSRFREILRAAQKAGYLLSTPSQVLHEAGPLEENPYVTHIEDGVAWHGGTAKAWANTRQSRILDPVCRSIWEGIRVLEGPCAQNEQAASALETARDAVESAWVSDARWPPEPTSPGRFNVREALDDLYHANDALARAMEAAGIQEERTFYSPQLMGSQIAFIDKELMALPYFEECGKVAET